MENISTYEQQANDFLTKTGATIEKKFLKFDHHFGGEKQKRNVFEITISKDGKNMVFNFGQSVNDSCEETAKIEEGENEPINLIFGYSYKGIDAIHKGEINTDLFTLRAIKNGTKDINELLTDSYLNECTENFKYEILQHNKKSRVRVIDYAKPRIDTIEQFRQRGINKINEEIEKLSREKLHIYQKNAIIEPTNYDILTCLTKYDPETFENFCSEFGYDEDSIKALKTYEAVKKESADLQTLFNEEELNELAEIQ